MYEQLFYDRLRCNSPEKVADLLQRALNTVREPITELRVLDLGAGNGMMGEVLKRNGVARLVGADIISEAQDAAYRDRSTVYDDYYVADLMNLDPDTLEQFREWRFDCLTCVAALGFGDIPPRAFFRTIRNRESGKVAVQLNFEVGRRAARLLLHSAVGKASGASLRSCRRARTPLSRDAASISRFYAVFNASRRRSPLCCSATL